MRICSDNKKRLKCVEKNQQPEEHTRKLWKKIEGEGNDWEKKYSKWIFNEKTKQYFRDVLTLFAEQCDNAGINILKIKTQKLHKSKEQTVSIP